VGTVDPVFPTNVQGRWCKTRATQSVPECACKSLRLGWHDEAVRAFRGQSAVKVSACQFPDAVTSRFLENSQMKVVQT